MRNHSYLSKRPYVIGFVASLVLTLIAYFLVLSHVNSGHLAYSRSFLVAWIMVLAAIQFVVQAVFFLHVGKEPKPRWNLMAFLFTIMVVLIIVLGSLWIMANLSRYHIHRLPPEQAEKFITENEAIEPASTEPSQDQQASQNHEH